MKICYYPIVPFFQAFHIYLNFLNRVTFLFANSWRLKCCPHLNFVQKCNECKCTLLSSHTRTHCLYWREQKYKVNINKYRTILFLFTVSLLHPLSKHHFTLIMFLYNFLWLSNWLDEISSDVMNPCKEMHMFYSLGNYFWFWALK
jgi:hypothetical protein